jgi:hypothetical protein
MNGARVAACASIRRRRESLDAALNETTDRRKTLGNSLIAKTRVVTVVSGPDSRAFWL